MAYVFAFDFETFLIEPGLLAPRAVCMSFADRPTRGIVLPMRGVRHCNPAMDPTEGAKRAFIYALDTADIITGANTAYDMGVAAANWPELLEAIFKAYDEGRVRDVQINQMLIDIARGRFGGYVDGYGKKQRAGYSLADLEQRLLGRDRHAEKTTDPDAWRLRFAELWNVPMEQWPERAVDYALGDSDGALELELAQAAEGALLEDAAAQARASFALHLMSARGIKTDASAIERFRESTEAEYRRLCGTLRIAGLMRDDGSRDTKKAKERMAAAYAALGKEPRLTEKGAISLDEEACTDSGDELLESYAEASSLMTVVRAHIPALLKGTTTPIQARFNVLVETGRTSCSFNDKNTGNVTPTNGYQLQNVRRLPGIRECFVPRPGFVFGDVDFNGQEMHTWAQVCLVLLGHSRLAERLNEGLDPHLDGAAQVLEIPYDEAKARRKAGDEAVLEHRQMFKAANFGFPGGLGPAAFVAFAKGNYGVRIPLGRAFELKQQWMANWPEAQPYFDYIRDLCAENGVATVQHLYSKRWRGLIPYTVACNTFFQGLAADASKAALYAVTRACFTGVNDLGKRSPLLGSRPVNFAHDQILAEHPADLAEEAVVEMRDIMCRVASRYTPDVPHRAEPTLTVCWSKDAEAVYEGGRLVPWDPVRHGKAVTKKVAPVPEEVYAMGWVI